MKYVPQKINKNPFKILFKNEFKQHLKSFIWWTVIISVVMFSFIALYPLMADMINLMNAVPSEMMDAMIAITGGDLTTITGYYVMESTETLLIAGSIFAGLLGVSLINKDFNGGSSEFLYALPASKGEIWRSKLTVLFTQIFLFNLIVSLTSLAGMYIFGSGVNIGSYFAYFGLVFILQLEFAIVCFSLASAFKTKANAGVAMAIIFISFILNIIRNIITEASFIKYISPFAYVSGLVMTNGLSEVNFVLLAIGAGISIVALLFGRIKYSYIDVA
ncbi:MAG: ABC transporter permease subunit [Clostridia bacterium]|jgi:ABC-2 type transport system permease protein|nr:ABC transporter permease [Clostridia bacterium]MDD4275518.1 ABC transporter permease subunit [Clostridia bacterium]